jgi:hypothetical protein
MLPQKSIPELRLPAAKMDAGTDLSARIDNAAVSLEQEAGELAGEHGKLLNDLATLVTPLNPMQSQMPPGTDSKPTAAAKQAAGDMKDYLAQREQIWKIAGANAVVPLMTAKTAVTGIP